MRSKLTVATLAVCLLAGVASATAADRVKSKTSLNLGPRQGQFTGAVRSSEPVCVSGRRIKVKRVRAQRDKTIGKDFSDINGLWSVRTDESSGSWYAKLKRAKVGNVRCSADRSPTRSAG
jgi:hypothetical protein